MLEFVLIANLWVNPAMVKTLEDVTVVERFSQRVKACSVDMGYTDTFLVKNTTCKEVMEILNGKEQ